MGRCVQPISLRTLLGTFSGSAAAVYPNAVQIAQIAFQVSYALVGLQLSSSIVAFGTRNAGIFVVVGQTPPNIAVSNSINSPISHITQPNSLTGPPIVAIPTSKVTSLSFGAFALPIPANTPISLYAFMDATAGNNIFAICSLQLAAIQ